MVVSGGGRLRKWRRRKEKTELERLLSKKASMSPFDPLKVEYAPIDVFLFDLSQLSDPNKTRRDAFRRDVSHFLLMSSDLPR